jgi:hypothetical protein
MPLFSGFTPFGHLAFSGKPSHGESIYRTLKDNFGDVFDTGDQGLQQARLYAQSMVLASAQYQLDRAKNNKFPGTATELLGVLEHDYQVVPSSKATLNDRRAYLSAVQKITRGNRREAIEDALRTLLGSDFIAYRTTLPADIATLPASPGTVGVFAGRGTQKKVFQIDGTIAIIGTPVFVPITMLSNSGPPLTGEKYCIDPDPRRNIEQVTIGIVLPDPLFVEITFTKSHESGTLGTRPHPYWISNQRYDRIVVSLAAAKDPETRRKINELMGRALRGVSQWAIMHDLGYFTCDDPVLGLPDCTPVF